MSAQAQSTYSLGYGPDMVGVLQMRSAKGEARHLLPHLTPGMHLLDAGCGPGSITLGLAAAVGPQGRVTAIDFEPSQVELARNAARDAAVANISFERADVTALPFGDATFDAIHTHAVICHVPDHTAALAEMFRVLRPGGVIATTDPVFSRTVVIPEDPDVAESFRMLGQAMDSLGGDGDFGLRSAQALHDAGFVRLEIAPALDALATHQTPGLLAAMAQALPDRDANKTLLKKGLITRDRLSQIQEALRATSRKPFYNVSVMHVSIVGRKP